MLFLHSKGLTPHPHPRYRIEPEQLYNSARRDVSSTIDRRNLQSVLSLVDLPRIFIHRIFDSSSSKKKRKETRSSRNLQEEPEDWIEFEEDERQDSERERAVWVSVGERRQRRISNPVLRRSVFEVTIIQKIFCPSSARNPNMEPLTWCTRRLGGSVAASEESTIAVTLAKVAATTSSRLSTNANPVNDCSSTTTWICGTTCRLTDTSEDANSVLRHCHCWSSSATPGHDGPPLSLFLPNRQNQSNVCDLCERLRGRSCDYSTLDEKSTEGRFDRITRRGQRQVVNRDVNHTMISSKISQRDRLVSDASSTSYVSSVVRWSLRPERSFRWTRQKHALAWTILFLLVLVPSTSANLQKGMSRGSSKEEGGEFDQLRLYLPFVAREMTFETAHGKRSTLG